MKKSRYTEQQIAFALRQAEGSAPVGDVCRQMGVSEASFYAWKKWKKKSGKLGRTEIRKLRQLRDENARLKRLVADLTLDKHILEEVIEKTISEARPASRAGVLSCRAPWLTVMSVHHCVLPGVEAIFTSETDGGPSSQLDRCRCY